MGIMELVLIILGIIAFVLSFLLPAGKKNDGKDYEKLYEEAVREMVNREVEGARPQISGIVDETITYAMEKTERSFDRLTNEKMMAINEYSDTVLGEINKNHKEVVFLYDMLNDKHESLKSAVSEAAKTASDIKQTVKDAEITAKEVQKAVTEAAADSPKAEDEFIPIAPVEVKLVHESMAEAEQEKPAAKEPEDETSRKKTRKPRTPKAADKAAAVAEAPRVEVDLSAVGKNSGRNNNERILELHKAGKSNMAIARELGLGIGEVQLVIDLFKGI